MRTRPTITSRRLSGALFAATLVAFLLPFGAVSCDGEKVSFSGAELAAFSVPADPAGGTLHTEVEDEASFLALVVLAAAASGLGLAFAGRAGGGICATVGALGMQLLVVQAASTLAEVWIGYGFLLVFGLLIAAGCTHLTLALNRRRRRHGRVWPLTVGAGLWAPLLLATMALAVSLALGAGAA